MSTQDTCIPKTVIVTGAAGQDGSLMIDYLLKNTPHNIVGTIQSFHLENLKNLEGALLNDRFQIYPLSLTDYRGIENLIEYFQPDFFINCAAQTNIVESRRKPEETFRVNYLAVAVMLEAIRRMKKLCRFANAGSSEELSPADFSPQNELSLRHFNNPYGMSKVLAHDCVETYRGLGVFAIQPYLYNHISERLNKSFLPQKIVDHRVRMSRRDGHKHEILKLGNLDAMRDWTDAREVVEAVWLCLNAKIPKDYIIASGKGTTVRELFSIAYKDQIARNVAANTPYGWSDGTFLFGPHAYAMVDKELFRPEEPIPLVGDASLIEKDLGWKACKSLETIIEEMIIKYIDSDRK